MSAVDPSSFEVISRDSDGDPVRCSHCARGMEHVVVLPLTERPELEDRIRTTNGEELWIGLCAYCVLAMARALADARGKIAS